MARMSRSRWILLAAGCALARPAWAAPPVLDGMVLQHGQGIEVGALYEGGATEFAANNVGLSPTMQGVVLRDRNGVTAKWVFGLVIAVAEAFAESGPKSIHSETHDEGDWRVTTTTTTFYSEAEKAEMRQNANDSIDGVFSAPYSDFELHVYSRDTLGFGDSSGYKANFLVGAGKKLAYESGFGFGHVESYVDDMGSPTRVKYRYFGMPFRLSGVLGPARVALSYEWNWLKYGIENPARQVHADAMGLPMVETASHPWKLDVSTLVLGKVSVTGGVTAQQIQKAKYGYFVSAGMHF